MHRLLYVVALAATATVATAHVRITTPTPRTTIDLKSRHCGATGSARANVQTYRPGATVHLVWDIYIAHPGWIRVSFNPAGDTFRIPPGVSGGYPTENLTGMADPGGSGSTIIADRLPVTQTSLDVVLPNAECNNCTLQVIEMMTDKPPYTIDPLSNDIYFACVDLVVSASTPIIDAGIDAPGSVPVDAGPGADAGVGINETSGGCGCAQGGSPSGMLAVAVAIGWVIPRRRRRG
jgi:uncharacterized protein (TIGR03382 family)